MGTMTKFGFCLFFATCASTAKKWNPHGTTIDPTINRIITGCPSTGTTSGTINVNQHADEARTNQYSKPSTHNNVQLGLGLLLLLYLTLKSKSGKGVITL
jgi:hypothetical protein